MSINYPRGRRGRWTDEQWQKFYEYEKQEMQEEAKKQVAIDERRDWIKSRGIKRISNMIATRLRQKGFGVEIKGLDSMYIRASDQHGFVADVRVSLHQQAVGGGFNVNRQARTGEAIVSIDPYTTITIDEAVHAVTREA